MGALAEQVTADGYELKRGRCARPQANGETDPSTKTVTVRDDLSPAQAAKTLAHERAYILLGHVDGVASYQARRGRFEVEVESVAYLRVHAARPRCRRLLTAVRGAVGRR